MLLTPRTLLQTRIYLHEIYGWEIIVEKIIRLHTPITWGKVRPVAIIRTW